MSHDPLQCCWGYHDWQHSERGEEQDGDHTHRATRLTSPSLHPSRLPTSLIAKIMSHLLQFSRPQQLLLPSHAASPPHPAPALSPTKLDRDHEPPAVVLAPHDDTVPQLVLGNTKYRLPNEALLPGRTAGP